jgi:hypothetical protein
MSLASFVAALPMLLAADAGAPADTPPAANGDTPPAAADAPALIPAPRQRFAERAERIALRDANDGSGDLLYQGNGFSARIAPDGSVTFSDKRISDATLVPWVPMRARMGVPSLESSLRMLLGGRKPAPPPPSELDEGLAPPETKQLIPEVSRYRPDPREGCRTCSGFNELAVPVQGMARFDLTDELTRFSDQDPNRYQKAVFLAATHERRIQMAVRTHAANIRRASAELPARLQAIACDDRLSHRERRAILVQLGREMDPTRPEGAGAAKAITGFVDRFDAGQVVCARPSP